MTNSGNVNLTSKRKKDHIELCLTDKVAYKTKTNGFDKYEFEHYAITEVDRNKIDLTIKFFGRKINFPFLISCMTGGTSEAENINYQLALAANELKIPIGVGSQRQALENSSYINSYKILRKQAKDVPVLGNIGAAQIVKLKDPIGSINFLIDHIEADAMVIHINPLQELLQFEGEPEFKGLLKVIEKLTHKIKIPFIAKEVGSGISKKAAKKLLDVGIKGIDVSGAGGTSWAAVELLRGNNSDENYFRDWGLPTAYCIKETAVLKKQKKFLLIASGGITSGIEIAKAIALGADLAASARPLLQTVLKKGSDGVKDLLLSWFEDLKRVMYLTGCSSIKELQKQKLIKNGEIY